MFDWIKRFVLIQTFICRFLRSVRNAMLCAWFSVQTLTLDCLISEHSGRLWGNPLIDQYFRTSVPNADFKDARLHILIL